MNKYVPEINDFEIKAKKFADKLIELNHNNPTDIDMVANLAGINNEDVSSLVYYLKRGELIQTDKESKLAKPTLYGELMFKGEIKNGYFPLL